MALVTPRFLSPVSTVSVCNAYNHDCPFGAHAGKKKRKKKRNACKFRVSLLKQEVKILATSGATY